MGRIACLQAKRRKRGTGPRTAKEGEKNPTGPEFRIPGKEEPERQEGVTGNFRPV